MNRGGYSLVEILVAVLLMGLVMTSALLLMQSTHRVTDQIAFEHSEEAPLSKWESASMQLRRDLDHVQAPLIEDAPGFVLVTSNRVVTIEWLSLATVDTKRLPVQIRYLYDVDDRELRRATAGLHRSAAFSWETNTVLSSVTEFAARVHDGTTWHPEWPVGDGDTLPRLLELVVQTRGDEPRTIHALLPVSLGQEGEEEQE